MGVRRSLETSCVCFIWITSTPSKDVRGIKDWGKWAGEGKFPTIKTKRAVNSFSEINIEPERWNNKASAGASDKNKYGDLHDVYHFIGFSSREEINNFLYFVPFFIGAEN